MATRAQSADCHDSCDGVAGLRIGFVLLLENGYVEFEIDMMPFSWRECLEIHERSFAWAARGSNFHGFSSFQLNSRDIEY